MIAISNRWINRNGTGIITTAVSAIILTLVIANIAGIRVNAPPLLLATILTIVAIIASIRTSNISFQRSQYFTGPFTKKQKNVLRAIGAPAGRGP